jgi:hypothetical protein
LIFTVFNKPMRLGLSQIAQLTLGVSAAWNKIPFKHQFGSASVAYGKLATSPPNVLFADRYRIWAILTPAIFE